MSGTEPPERMFYVSYPGWRTRWYWRFLRPKHDHDWLWFDTAIGSTGYATCRRCGLFGRPPRRPQS